MTNQELPTIYVRGDLFEVVETRPSGRRILECIMRGKNSHHRVKDVIVWYSEREEAEIDRGKAKVKPTPYARWE